MTINNQKNSVTLRMFIVAVLFLALLIPLALISELVNERQQTKTEAVNDVSSKWGNAQELVGPILTLHYKEYYLNADGKQEQIDHDLHVLPSKLSVQSQLNTQTRERDIYEVVLYTADLKMSGEFDASEILASGIEQKNFVLSDATLSMGISDPRGIKSLTDFQWNKGNLDFNAGLADTTLFPRGVSAKVPVASLSATDNYSFSFDLGLNGSQNLSIVPIGKETNLTMSSDWDHPGFQGDFLPDNYDIREGEGFDADWKVLGLSRSFPASWKDDNYKNLSFEKIGLELVLPLDEYQKTFRSVKYAALVIALTFIAFFFVEIFQKKRIHPLQYLLVGFSLVIFYTLLLAISEQLSFDSAYLISALATILLVMAYVWKVFGKLWTAVLQASILVITYAFIYILIQQEDYALLIGSIGLFVIVAILMYVSTKVNWYEKDDQKEIK